MKAEQLLELLNKHGLEQWPKLYEVNADTYANVCQAVFDHKRKDPNGYTTEAIVFLGVNGGIKFHGVELILKSWESASSTQNEHYK